MRKLLHIAWKDLILTFRDQAAMIMMLVTPFALTLVMAFAFGGLTGGSGNTGMSAIPVVIVNDDDGQFGQTLVDVFRSPDMADLVQTSVVAGAASARQAVDANQAAAAVIIPAGFSNAIVPAGATATGASGGQVIVEVYQNPTRPIGAGVVRSIADQTVGSLTAGAVAGQVAVTQLIANGLIAPQQAMTQGAVVGERAGRQVGATHLVVLESQTGETNGANSNNFDWLTYMAPSMAIMFLMFTVSNGGRSLLAERDWGTLPRMLATPTAPAHVIGGKVAGIYVTGLTQMVILIAASSLLFNVNWGSGLGVTMLTLALVAAATGWGAVLAAYSRNAAQASQVGTMIALIFGMLAGNFFPRFALPQWLQTAGMITPNAWGLEGFTSLSAGAGVEAVLAPVAALLIMATVLFGLATVAFRRQYA